MIHLEPSEMEAIRTWNDSVSASVTLVCHKTQDSRSSALESFCEELSRLADKVDFRMKGEGDFRLPAIQIGSGWIYHGIPRDHELQSFLRLLSISADAVPHIPGSVRESVRHIKRPAELTLYTGTHCVYCPHVINALAPLPFASRWLRVTSIDVSLFPEQAQAEAVKAVPTLIYNNRFRWTGPIQIHQVLEVISHDDPGQLGSEVYVRMLKEGDAERLAEMMIDAEMIFPAFVTLLTHPEWSVRLGAIVAIEAVREKKPELAGKVLPELWAVKDRLDSSQLGDVLYLVGELGGREWTDILTRYLATVTEAELLEVGHEALVKLGKGQSAR